MSLSIQRGVRVFRNGPAGSLARALRTIEWAYQTCVRSKPARSNVQRPLALVIGRFRACLGRLDAAIEEINRAIDARYRTYLPYSSLAAVEAAKGNDAEAKLALAAARRLNPKLTVKWYKENFPGRTSQLLLMAGVRRGCRKNER